jgi:hypothetical protein
MGMHEGLDGIASILAKVIMDQSYEKTPVGNISKELCSKFRDMHRKKEDVEKELETRKDILQSEMELALYKEFREKMESFDDEKTSLWEEATKELGVDPEENYSVDFKTGVVSKKVKKERGNNPFENVGKKRW